MRTSNGNDAQSSLTKKCGKFRQAGHNLWHFDVILVYWRSNVTLMEVQNILLFTKEENGLLFSITRGRYDFQEDQ